MDDVLHCSQCGCELTEDEHNLVDEEILCDDCYSEETVPVTVAIPESGTTITQVTETFPFVNIATITTTPNVSVADA